MSARQRIPNHALAAARVRNGWPQAELARRVDGELGGSGAVTAHYVSRLECGYTTWPNEDHRAAFRAVLKATDVELGFYCSRSNGRPPATVRGGSSSTQEVSNMRRRNLVTGTAALAFGMALGKPVTEFLERVSEGYSPLKRVGATEIAQINYAVRAAHDWDNLFGGNLARATVDGHVVWAVGNLRARYTDAVHGELHSAVGHLCEVAGWMHFDAGAQNKAREYLDLALYCAGKANDPALRAITLTDLARQSVYLNQPDDALDYLGFAKAQEHRLAPSLRGLISGVQARAYARKDDDRACLRAIGHTEDAYTDGSPENDPEWLSYPHRAQLYGDSGEALADLARQGRQVNEASRRLQAAADTYPESYARSRAFVLSQLATIQFMTGDPAQALATGRETVKVASALASRRVHRYLYGLDLAAGKHPTVPGVARLRHELAELLPAS